EARLALAGVPAAVGCAAAADSTRALLCLAAHDHAALHHALLPGDLPARGRRRGRAAADPAPRAGGGAAAAGLRLPARLELQRPEPPRLARRRSLREIRIEARRLAAGA